LYKHYFPVSQRTFHLRYKTQYINAVYSNTPCVCVKANNPSPVSKVPEGQGVCNTGQYIRFCGGGGCVEQH